MNYDSDAGALRAPAFFVAQDLQVNGCLHTNSFAGRHCCSISDMRRPSLLLSYLLLVLIFRSTHRFTLRKTTYSCINIIRNINESGISLPHQYYSNCTSLNVFVALLQAAWLWQKWPKIACLGSILKNWQI